MDYVTALAKKELLTDYIGYTIIISFVVIVLCVIGSMIFGTENIRNKNDKIYNSIFTFFILSIIFTLLSCITFLIVINTHPIHETIKTAIKLNETNWELYYKRREVEWKANGCHVYDYTCIDQNTKVQFSCKMKTYETTSYVDIGNGVILKTNKSC